jgi:hypothetical protein
MKAINYLIILAASVFIFSACTKEIAGPTGPNGAQGAQGAASSYKVVIDSILPGSGGPNQWSLSGSGAYFYTINNITWLTASNSSIVEVYFSYNLGTTATYYEIPLPNALQTGDYLDFNYSNYIVNLVYTFGTAPAQQIYVKIVIITQP